MKDKILEILQRVLEVDKIDTKASRRNIDSWDSLRQINLIVELETEFDINIEPEEIEKMVDFSTIESVLKEKLEIKS